MGDFILPLWKSVQVNPPATYVDRSNWPRTGPGSRGGKGCRDKVIDKKTSQIRLT